MTSIGTYAIAEMAAQVAITFTLPDGSSLAYEILGSEHLGTAIPIVLICGVTNIRSDFKRLSAVLSKTRAVLVYDHRGIGQSKFASEHDEVTIESMARDLQALLAHLQWEKIALLGFSMGGVILQQLLLLPSHPTNPTELGFEPTHVLLISTRSVVLPPEYGIQLPTKRPETLIERAMVAKKIFASSLDPKWIEENEETFEIMFRHIQLTSFLRPAVTIGKQNKALHSFNIIDQLHNFPREPKVLVIHGERDQVIPMKFAQDMMDRIPTAKFIQTGDRPGQVPNLEFGHTCWAYFDLDIWANVVNEFIRQ